MSYLKQFRWCSPDSSPEFNDSTIFNKNLIELLGSNAYVRELGILAKANTPFEINGIPLVIGPTERYELDSLIITSLKFPLNGNENNTHIIVDMIYEREE
jgi:hypothetical protein